jgi:hypothetical protein
MGHRDVYGTTICPGDQAHLLIPWLRDQIADRIGLVDPFLYADENTPAFTRSNSGGDWLVPPYLCGFNNHAWYAWAVTSGGVSGANGGPTCPPPAATASTSTSRIATPAALKRATRPTPSSTPAARLPAPSASRPTSACGPRWASST